MLKPIRKDKKRKLYHFSDLIDDFTYTDFKECEIEIVGGQVLKGCLYCLERPSGGCLASVLHNYDNTSVVNTYCEYAHEITKVWLFIAY